MKKIYLILISIFLIVPVIVHANTEEAIPLMKVDFIKIASDSNDIMKERTIILKDGNNKDVEVKLSVGVLEEDTESFIKKLKDTNLHLKIDELISGTRSRLKNPYSFIPREVRILNDRKSDSKIYVELKYTAENSYGGTLLQKVLAIADKN